MSTLFHTQVPTPLVDLSGLSGEGGARLVAKAEFMNPGLSLKDRIARHIIDSALADGDLAPGQTIVCASSGNTGCSVAAIGRALGHPVIVVTTPKCSAEKRAHISAYGAEVRVEPNDYMSAGQQLARRNGWFDVAQYTNPRNPDAHFRTTGPEIWEQTKSAVTHFVMTGSTFGCFTGTSRFLKSRNPDLRAVLVDPEHSHVRHFVEAHRSGGALPAKVREPMEPYAVEGAGKSKPTPLLDLDLVDDVIVVSDTEAITTCHRLASEKSILAGGSSGLNVAAALRLARSLPPDATVVTVLCDHGVKYLSKIYDADYLERAGIEVEAQPEGAFDPGAPPRER